MITTTSPRFTVRSQPRRAWYPLGYHFSTPRASIITSLGGVALLLRVEGLG
jgi:hypothetical protein